MIQEKEITVAGKRFIISKFNYEDGREIVTQYMVSAIPKLGDYARNKELVRMMMGYVAIPMESGVPLRLSTPELINNHITDWEMGMQLEAAMMEYNCSFFQNGRISDFLDECALNIPEWIFKAWTELSERFSQKAKQRLTN